MSLFGFGGELGLADFNFLLIPELLTELFHECCDVEKFSGVHGFQVSVVEFRRLLLGVSDIGADDDETDDVNEENLSEILDSPREEDEEQEQIDAVNEVERQLVQSHSHWCPGGLDLVLEKGEHAFAQSLEPRTLIFDDAFDEVRLVPGYPGMQLLTQNPLQGIEFELIKLSGSSLLSLSLSLPSNTPHPC